MKKIKFAALALLGLGLISTCGFAQEDDSDNINGPTNKNTPANLVPPNAGSHGFVKVDPATQRLVFDDGTPASFFGVNFTGFLDDPDQKESTADMDKILDDLKAMGVNVIRFQTYDNKIQKGVFGKGLNAVAMENRDRFIAEGKKRGIYFHMCMNVSSPAKGGSTELMKKTGGGREMVILIDQFINYQKTYAVNILNHVNPYTGLAYKDEPAIISLQLGNEQHAYSRDGWRKWTDIKGPPGDELRGRWNKFLIDKYGDREKLATAWKDLLKPEEDPAKNTVAIADIAYPTWDNKFVPTIRQQDETLFADAMQDRFYKEMRDCIRHEAGDKKHLISDNGWIRGDDRIIGTANKNLDLMDLQHYWPHGPRMRLTEDNKLSVSPIKDCGINILSSLLTARDYHGTKKASFVTEYNSHKDNIYLFQLVPVHTVFARMTGFDGETLWNYSNGDSDGLMNKDHWFSFNRDNVDIPKSLIPFLAGAYLWRSSIPEVIDSNTIKDIARLDGKSTSGVSVDYDASLQQAVSVKSFVNKAEGITIDFPQNRLVIDRSDVFFFTGRGDCQGAQISFHPSHPDVDYLFAVFPLDGKTLADAKSWRVFSTMDGDAKISRADLNSWMGYNRGYHLVRDTSTGSGGADGRQYSNKGEIASGAWHLRRPVNAVYFDLAKK